MNCGWSGHSLHDYFKHPLWSQPCNLPKQNPLSFKEVIYMKSMHARRLPNLWESNMEVVMGNCQLSKHLQGLYCNECKEAWLQTPVQLVTLLLCRWEQKSPSIFTPACREMSHILPWVPYPAQANEHHSQPASTYFTSKLDLAVKKSSQMFAPPRVPNGCTHWFSVTECSR